MNCYARWEKDNKAGVFFRDQTILQYGESWDLIANFILLNPGSALPKNKTNQTEFLASKKLPFFVYPKGEEKYLEFSIDPLMRSVVKILSTTYSGGVIRLYNLFNLKNQHSNEAVKQLSENKEHPKMFAKNSEIKFCNAPVIVASGGKARANKYLKRELIHHIEQSKVENLYKIAKIDKKEFSIVQVLPDESGFIDSYHPSYTCKYGNSTTIGELST